MLSDSSVTELDRKFPLPGLLARPALLVSVQNADEARVAIAAGGQILDVKQPQLGSLGKASEETIFEVSNALSSHSKIPLSVALGEAADFAERPEVHALPANACVAKLGLSKLGGRKDWMGEWLAVRHEWGLRGGKNLQWVAVIYADRESAQSPMPEEIIAAAIQTRCAGVLIDTFDKSLGGLLAHLSVERVRELAERTQEGGLFFAVAGKLRRADLIHLSTISADVFAVRGDVCREGSRTSELDPWAIREWRKALLEKARSAAGQ